MFPLLDEMLLETPAFSMYHKQQNVEKFSGADLDRLQRQVLTLKTIIVLRQRKILMQHIFLTCFFFCFHFLFTISMIDFTRCCCVL